LPDVSAADFAPRADKPATLFAEQYFSAEVEPVPCDDFKGGVFDQPICEEAFKEVGSLAGANIFARPSQRRSQRARVA
jgi:hypothetical protein